MADEDGGVEDITNRTRVLGMDDEDDDWDPAEESAVPFTDEGILGRLVTRKPIRRQALGALLEGLWSLSKGWRLKLLDSNETGVFFQLWCKKKQESVAVAIQEVWFYGQGVIGLGIGPLTGTGGE